MPTRDSADGLTTPSSGGGDGASVAGDGDGELLAQIFPQHVVEALRKRQNVLPDRFDDVGILFADVVGWTELCASLKSPMQAHCLLHELFCVIDYCLLRFPRLYKTETIGDCVLIMGGAPVVEEPCLDDLLRFALLIPSAVKKCVLHPVTGEPVAIRVGIHVGNLVGGIMGRLMPRYTFSGDAINVAARFQSISTPGRVVISSKVAQRIVALGGPCTVSYPGKEGEAAASRAQTTVDLLRDVESGIDSGVVLSFKTLRLTSLGLAEVKGKGLMAAFFVESQDVLERPSVPRSKSLDNLQQVPAPIERRVVELRRIGSFDDLTVLLMSAKTAVERCRQHLQDEQVKRAFLDSTWIAADDSDSTIVAEEDVWSLPEPLGTPSPRIPAARLGMQEGLEDAAAARAARAAKSANAALEQKLSTLRVMVIEDSTAQRKLICRQLKEVGPCWTIDAVAGLAEAKAAITACACALDLLLVDMNLGMGHFDGVGLVSQLKLAYPQSMTTVATVLMSREASEKEFFAVANSLGGDCFWAKPLPETEVLAWYVRTVIAAKMSGPAASERSAFIDGTEVKLADALLRGYASDGNLSAPRPVATATGGPMRVLIVEDSSVQRAVMVAACKRCFGGKVVGVADPASCLALLGSREAAFDLVLVDMDLGDDAINGAELVRHVLEAHGSSSLADALIIGVTAGAAISANAFREAGADAVWSKPLPAEVLIRHRLSILLKARHGGRLPANQAR